MWLFVDSWMRLGSFLYFQCSYSFLALGNLLYALELSLCLVVMNQGLSPPTPCPSKVLLLWDTSFMTCSADCLLPLISSATWHHSSSANGIWMKWKSGRCQTQSQWGGCEGFCWNLGTRCLWTQTSQPATWHFPKVSQGFLKVCYTNGSRNTCCPAWASSLACLLACL